MRKSLLALSLTLLIITIQIYSTRQTLADPCDNYGDCVSSSITYIRSNPDHTLYLGDEFTVSLSVVPGSGSASCGSGCSESWSGQLARMTWSYDNTAFHANATGSSADFIVVGGFGYRALVLSVLHGLPVNQRMGDIVQIESLSIYSQPAKC